MYRPVCCNSQARDHGLQFQFWQQRDDRAAKKETTAGDGNSTFVSMIALDVLKRRQEIFQLCLWRQPGATAAKWETSAWDAASTFIRLKPLDILKEISGHFPPVFVAQETTVWDGMSTFVDMKALDVFGRCQDIFQLCLWQQKQVIQAKMRSFLKTITKWV